MDGNHNAHAWQYLVGELALVGRKSEIALLYSYGVANGVDCIERKLSGYKSLFRIPFQNDQITLS